MDVISSPASVEGVRLGQGRNKEVLIVWKDLLEYEVTWELMAVIQQKFSDFHLADNVSFCEGSNVRDRPSKIQDGI